MIIFKLCSGCGGKAVYPKRFCDICEDKQDIKDKESRARSNKRYNRTRDKDLACFYSSKAWKSVSARRMQMAKYFCEYCVRALACEVHHELPINTPDGWEKRLDIDLVRAVCLRCHNEKHERFSGRAGRSAKPPGGGAKSVGLSPLNDT